MDNAPYHWSYCIHRPECVSVISQILHVFQSDGLLQERGEGRDSEGVRQEAARQARLQNPSLKHALHVVVGHGGRAELNLFPTADRKKGAFFSVESIAPSP